MRVHILPSGVVAHQRTHFQVRSSLFEHADPGTRGTPVIFVVFWHGRTCLRINVLHSSVFGVAAEKPEESQIGAVASL